MAGGQWVELISSHPDTGEIYDTFQFPVAFLIFLFAGDVFLPWSIGAARGKHRERPPPKLKKLL